VGRRARQALKLGRLTERLARHAAAYERQSEERAYGLARRVAETSLLEPLNAADSPEPMQLDLPRTRALLIINTKSGPHHDSVLYVREIVAMLARFNIRADVRVKLSKAQARKETRAAVKAEYPLVIAAGGDGTVEAIASGLIGSKTVLGVIPLGTYNNVASCLGIPRDLTEACALIAAGSPRAIDAGQITVQGKSPRIFFETCAIGLGAALTSVGQDADKGRWVKATRALPMLVSMPPTSTQIRLDGGSPRWANSLLVTVSNAPRAGAGLQLAPDARMDDGLLDVCVYDGLQQSDLATRFAQLRDGTIVDDPRVRCARAISVRVRSARPLPVTADSKLIGVTPARVVVRAGSVLALVGAGPGLAMPAPGTLSDVITDVADATPTANGVAAPPQPQLPQPIALNGATVLAGARVVALPVAAALLIRAVPPLLRELARRFDRR
jgi:YegS/Rv2252/BmrU family lipid kinase